MKSLTGVSLLAVLGLIFFAQANKHMYADAHDREETANILAVLEGEDGEKEEKEEKAVAEVVTVQGAAPEGNATCASQKTERLTEQPTAVAGESGFQLSFLTSTVFDTGALPTVTISQHHQTITQMVTVTVKGANAAVVSPPAGISSPYGTTESAETGNSADSSIPAATVIASPTATEPSAVGSSGAIANGVGTVKPDGFCACSCLCETGSFSNSTVAANPASLPATILQINTFTPASLLVASSAEMSGSLVSAATTFHTFSPEFSVVTSSPEVSSTIPGAEPPSSSSGSYVVPAAQSVATLPSTASSFSSKIDAASSGPPSTTNTSFEVSLASGTISTTQASAVGAIEQQPADPIDISAFSLASNLVLGSLAIPTVK